MMVKRVRHIAVVVAAAALAVSSCYFGGAEVEESIEVPTCQSDSDCGNGMVCDPKVNVCTTDVAIEMEAWFRLVPPPKGVAAVEEHYPSMLVTNAEEVPLTLHRPIHVVGLVRFENNPHASQDATIIAVAAGTIPDLSISEDANAGQGTTDYGTGTTTPGFEFDVNEGIPYDIYVYLAEAADEIDRPPYHVRRSFSRRAEAADPYTYEWEVSVPAAADYLHLTGCVKSSSLAGLVPVVGAKVVAVADLTANVSTADQTDEAGCFDIAVQPPVEMVLENYAVQLRPAAENELVPKAVLSELEVADHTDLGELVIAGLGELVPLDVVLVAEMDEAAAGVPEEEWKQQAAMDLTGSILGTTVQLAGLQEAGLLELERSVADVGTEEDPATGKTVVEAKVTFVIPYGSYVLSVIPPPQGKLALHQQVLTWYAVDGPPGELRHKLVAKTKAGFYVRDPYGNPVTGAHVAAVFANRGEHAEVAPLPPRSFDALPDDADGSLYRVFLDPGTYTLVIDPGADSGFPRKVKRSFPVEGPSLSTTVTLDLPALVTGRVAGVLLPEAGELAEVPAEDPRYPASKYGAARPYEGMVAGVKVELYDEKEGLSEPDSIPPVPIASGTTGADGSFVLLVSGK